MTLQTANDQSPSGPSFIAPGPRVLPTTQLGLILVGFAALIVATLASVALAQRNREAFELASRMRCPRFEGEIISFISSAGIAFEQPFHHRATLRAPAGNQVSHDRSGRSRYYAQRVYLLAGLSVRFRENV